ncbi:hypothetical protein QJQ45_005695 [Haematococcus lacustris]|nr:hypothetical protein QJQ45_005695 [Haematococcus lacustris]
MAAAAADNKTLEEVAVDMITFLARCGPRNQWDKYFAYFNDHFEGIQEPSPPEGLKPFASLWIIYKTGVQRSPAPSPALRRAPAARVQLSLAPSIPLVPPPAAGGQHQHHPPVQPHRQTRRGQWPQVGTNTWATGTAAGGQQYQHQQQDLGQVTEEEQQQRGDDGAGPSSSKRPRPTEDQALLQYLIQKVDTVQDSVNRVESSTGGTLLHGGAVRFPRNTQGMVYQLPTLLPYTGDVYQPHELEQCRRAALAHGLTIFQLPQLAIDMAAVVAASILITRVYNHMVFSSVNANSKTQYGTGQRVQVVLAKSDKNSSGDLDTTLTLLTDSYNEAVYSALTAEKKKEVDEAKKVLAQYLTLLQPVLRQLLGRPLNALASIITDPTWQRRLNRNGNMVTTLAEQLAQAQAPHTDFLPVGPGMDDGLVFLLALQDFPLVAYMGSHKLSQLAAAHCRRTADGQKQVVEVGDMDALAMTLPHQLGTEVLVKAGQLVLFRGNTVHAGNVGVAGSCCARLYGFGRPDTVVDNTTMNTSELGALYHGLFQPIQGEGNGPKMADWNRRGMAGHVRAHMHSKHKLGLANQDNIYYQMTQDITKAAAKGAGERVMTDATISIPAQRTALLYRTGGLYNQKLAMRWKQATDDRCPLCGEADSATHLLSGCSETLPLVQERHNGAGRLIAKAISKGTLGGCIRFADTGSWEKGARENLDLPNDTLHTTLRALGLKPTATKNTTRPDILMVAPQKKTGKRDKAIKRITIVEIKYCADSRWMEQLDKALNQHKKLAHTMRKIGHMVEIRPILLGIGPLLLAGTGGAETPNPSHATRAAAQAGSTRKLQEQKRREKRAAAELSIIMEFAFTDT